MEGNLLLEGTPVSSPPSRAIPEGKDIPAKKGICNFMHFNTPTALQFFSTEAKDPKKQVRLENPCYRLLGT